MSLQLRVVAVSERAALSGATPPQGRLTVSIPHYGGHRLVRGAVESILGQTYENLRLVVVSDGDPEPPWAELADITDPRLFRYRHPHNRGGFFASAIVAGASSDPYFAVQDADDSSQPGRIEACVRALRDYGADFVCHGMLLHEAGKPARRWAPNTRAFEQACAGAYPFYAGLIGAVRSQALRTIGGCYTGERLGTDRYLANTLAKHGRVVLASDGLYDRLIHPDSLTADARTGHGSPMRKAAIASQRDLYSRADSPDAVRKAVAERIAPDLRAELDQAITKVRALLDGQSST